MHFDAVSLLQDMPPKAGTPTTAQESAPGAPPSPTPNARETANPLWTFAPFLILIPFFFLTFRKQKKEQELRGKLKKGDRVLSQSGLIGELVELDERFAKVKIASGVTVQMLATSISPLDPAAKPADDLKDLKDAKVAADKK